MSVEEEVKKIVIARLETMSATKKISIGSAGEFGRDELIERVKKEDEIGKKMIQIELEFLRSFKKGIFA
jgi:hypothetical protein